MEKYSLVIKRIELKDALQSLAMAATKSNKVGELRLTLQDGDLVMTAAGVEVAVEAAGQWETPIVMQLRQLTVIRDKLPEKVNLNLKYAGERLHLENVSFPALAAENMKGQDPLSVLPINPQLADYLRLKYTMTAAEIAEAGLQRSINNASESALKLMLKAQEVLRPTGISLRDMEKMLELKYTVKK